MDKQIRCRWLDAASNPTTIIKTEKKAGLKEPAIFNMLCKAARSCVILSIKHLSSIFQGHKHGSLQIAGNGISSS